METEQAIVSILRAGTPQFAVAVLATLVASILLCRHRSGRKKPLFFLTALASAVMVNVVLFVVTFLLGRISVEGWSILTAEAWEWRAGLKTGDIVLTVNKLPVQGLADFYRKVWSLGNAGVRVPLGVLKDILIHDVMIDSEDRYQYLEIKTNR